jgi:cell division transport system ATP-binding protein
MLSVNHVYFSYHNQPVFSDLNLEIAEGEFAFLIGKSGVGKTSLTRMIYMDLLPDSGTVQVAEFVSDTIKPREITRLRRKLGLVFQDFQLLRDRNVYENISLILEITGSPRKHIKRKVMHVLTEVGLAHKYNNMPDELSGGEKQRIGIARAIVNDPILLVADEPTGNLDPDTSEEILDILKKINMRGTSVLFATHNYELVRKAESKIIKLENGKAVKVILKKKFEDN